MSTALQARGRIEIVARRGRVCVAVVVTRFVWVYLSSLLPRSPYRQIAVIDRAFAGRMRFIVGWAGLRGAVSLAAALALPQGFPERDLILLITFAVILVTLVGQGLTLPWLSAARQEWVFPTSTATTRRLLARSPTRPASRRSNDSDLRGRITCRFFDRMESSLRDRTQHLATEDADETADRRQERIEHEQIQLAVISAQRQAVNELRDTRQINDETLRRIERELDLEELRMEG